ncbi:MAG: hypothetical protein MHM6MM_001806 [Cercozoa sp. M6MM]
MASIKKALVQVELIRDISKAHEPEFIDKFADNAEEEEEQRITRTTMRRLVVTDGKQRFIAIEYRTLPFAIKPGTKLLLNNVDIVHGYAFLAPANVSNLGGAITGSNDDNNGDNNSDNNNNDHNESAVAQFARQNQNKKRALVNLCDNGDKDGFLAAPRDSKLRYAQASHWMKHRDKNPPKALPPSKSNSRSSSHTAKGGGLRKPTKSSSTAAKKAPMICPKCQKTYQKKTYYERHVASCTGPSKPKRGAGGAHGQRKPFRRRK